MHAGGSSQESLREELERAALARWGEDRLDALRPGLQNMARDLWLVAQQPLELLDEAPDLFGVALPAPVGDNDGPTL